MPVWRSPMPAWGPHWQQGPQKARGLITKEKLSFLCHLRSHQALAACLRRSPGQSVAHGYGHCYLRPSVRPKYSLITPLLICCHSLIHLSIIHYPFIYPLLICCHSFIHPFVYSFTHSFIQQRFESLLRAWPPAKDTRTNRTPCFPGGRWGWGDTSNAHSQGKWGWHR